MKPLDKTLCVVGGVGLVVGLLMRFCPHANVGQFCLWLIGCAGFAIAVWCAFKSRTLLIALLLGSTLMAAKAQVAEPKDAANICKCSLRATGIGAALYMIYELWRFCEENIPSPTNSVPVVTNSIPVSTNKVPVKKTAMLHIASSSRTIFLQGSEDGVNWFDIHSRTRVEGGIVTTNLLTGEVIATIPKYITNGEYTTFVMNGASSVTNEHLMFRLISK